MKKMIGLSDGMKTDRKRETDGRRVREKVRKTKRHWTCKNQQNTDIWILKRDGKRQEEKKSGR